MKSKEILSALNDVDDKYIADASAKKSRGSKRPLFIGIAAAAACACFAAFGIFSNLNGAERSAPIAPYVIAPYAIARAEYPETVQYPAWDDYEDFDEYLEQDKKWVAERNARRSQPKGYLDGLAGFTSAATRQILAGEDSINHVYSPLNVYLALSMLAEVTDGDSRAQILSLLGEDSAEALRSDVQSLWKANYINDGTVTSIMANSLWLDADIEYDQDTMDTLTQDYYASSFSGTMGTEEYTQMLRDWLNQQTGGLLSDQAQNIELKPETVIALASTLYFNARWQYEFYDGRNTEQTFHAPSGDITCEFMNQTLDSTFFWGDKFQAVKREFANYGGNMYLILPDEGVSVNDLLSDSETLNFITDSVNWDNSRYMEISLSLPKFDVSAETELSDSLKALGVSDIFDSAASNFSALMDSAEGITVSEVQHAARVTIDEEGCTAAAFTVESLDGEAPAEDTEKIDFVLDRPFIFAIVSDTNAPLFIGVVNDPLG